MLKIKKPPKLNRSKIKAINRFGPFHESLIFFLKLKIKTQKTWKKKKKL